MQIEGLEPEGLLTNFTGETKQILTTLQSPVLLTLNHKHCNYRHTYMKWVF